MALYTDDWHVRGIMDYGKETLIVGSEHDCRFIAKIMVGSGKWGDAWIHPPGSDSGPDYEHEGPFEVYSNTDCHSGERIFISQNILPHDVKPVYWHKFDE